MSKSQNGWLVQNSSKTLWPHPLVGPMLAGPVWVVLNWLITAFNLHVEPVRRAQSGCYNRRKISGSRKWSNHASATAVDLNWTRHPVGTTTGGFSAAQVETIWWILAELRPVIRWGGSAFKDPMHFEIAPGVTQAQVERLATKLLQAQLAQLGYDLGRAGVDGIRGQKTDAALLALQQAAGLTGDGIDGPNTWAAITTRLTQEATA